MRRPGRGGTVRSLGIELVLVALLVAGLYLFLMSGAADGLGRFIADRWQP